MNLPNLLTMIRFFLVIVFVYLFAASQTIAALVIFFIAGITDILDGYIARKYNMVTNWGKLLDPLADKFMVVSVLICLYSKHWIPLWVILVLIAKETSMILGSIFLYKRNVVVSSNIFGKAATVAFYAAIVMTFFKKWVYPANLVFLYITVVMSLLALVQYAIINLNVKKIK